MNNAQNPKRLKDIALALKDGERVRELCPFCAGGTTKELSFSMLRTGQAASYICYRASCGVRGRIKYGGIQGDISDTHVAATPKLKRFTGSSYNLNGKFLTGKFYSLFYNKYNISIDLLQEYNVKMTHDGRVLLPIIAPNGITRGDNIRIYPELLTTEYGINNAKAKIYIPDGEIVMSWHRLGCSPTNAGGVSERHPLSITKFFEGTLIIVEDQVSAIKASRMVDAVALLGTNLNFKKIKEISTEIARHKLYETIIILLDRDAYTQALKILIRTRALIKGIKIRRLDKDIKDISYTELYQLLAGVVSDDK